MTDFRSWPKKWNDASLGDYVTLPEFKQSGGQWSLLGMLALGLVAGAAIGGYAVSQRTQMKQLAKHVRRIGDELASATEAEADKPANATQRSNHRRKSTLEV
jgi:uncharacterized protein HemX